MPTNRRGTYLAGVQHGIDTPDAALRQSLDVCRGRETWIIARDPQGALVINAAICEYFATLPQVVTNVLLADPTRVPDQIGTADPGYEIFKDFTGLILGGAVMVVVGLGLLATPRSRTAGRRRLG